MKTIKLDKAEIIGRMTGVAYGQHWLVVAQDGSAHQIAWTSDANKLPTADGGYVAPIPVGLYDDEQDDVARNIVDADEERQWRYITDTVEAYPDVVQYTRMVYPGEWNVGVETAVRQVADKWLELLNQARSEQGPWGFERSPDGEGYVPITPPFRLAWE